VKLLLLTGWCLSDENGDDDKNELINEPCPFNDILLLTCSCCSLYTLLLLSLIKSALFFLFKLSCEESIIFYIYIII